MTNRTVSNFRKAFSGTDAAIRFLRMIDDEQIMGVSVKVQPVDLDARERAGTAPPERDPRPAGVTGETSDKSGVREVQDNVKSVLDGLGDSDGSGDSGNPTSPPPSDESADQSDDDGGTPDRGDGADGPEVPEASTGDTRTLAPNGSYHKTLYLIAVYEHETGDTPSNNDLYDYFPDEYDRETQVSPLTSVLHLNFEVLDRDTASSGRSWCYEYTVNGDGIDYLRRFGCPTEGEYAVAAEHRYAIHEVDDAAE